MRYQTLQSMLTSSANRPYASVRAILRAKVVTPATLEKAHRRNGVIRRFSGGVSRFVAGTELPGRVRAPAQQAVIARWQSGDSGDAFGGERVGEERDESFELDVGG
ncbi:hypothetical protein GCM10023198_34070 [Promicromonospora umidemergens]|uniref:Winged helix-turn helix protein n=1 Tax=Promicromonospora umidemergens TaxID=629679 RepID=A0ABP8XJ92_9MICO